MTTNPEAVQEINVDLENPEYVKPSKTLARKAAEHEKLHIARTNPSSSESRSTKPSLVPLTVPWRDLEQFGEGFSLYFGFCIFLIKLFVALSAIHTPLAVWYYINGSADISSSNIFPQTPTSTQEVLKTSVIAVDPENDSFTWAMTQLMNYISFVVYIAGVAWFINSEANRTSRDISDERHVFTPADYTIQVANCPSNVLLPQAYKDYFEKFGRVCNVAIGYDHGSLPALHQNKKLIREELAATRLEESQEIQDPKFSARLRRFVRRILCGPIILILRFMGFYQDSHYWQLQLDSLTKIIKELEERDYSPVRVFVSFNTPFQRNLCVESFQLSKFSLKGIFRKLPICGNWFYPKELLFNGHKIRVGVAPEPSDIQWANLHVSPFRRTINESITVSVMFLIVLLSFAIIVLLELFSFNLSSLLAIFSSAVIVLINRILYATSFAFTDSERHTTYTRAEESLFQKLLLFQLANTAFVVMIVSTIRAESVNPFYWSKAWYQDSVQQILLILVGDVLLNNLMRIISPYYIFQRVLGSRHFASQERMNEVFKGPEFRLAECYANQVKTLYVVLIYVSALPACAPLALVYFFVSYWADKYRLLRVCRAPPALDDTMGKELPRLLWIGLLLRGVFGAAAVFDLDGNLALIFYILAIVGSLFLLIFSNSKPIRTLLCIPLSFFRTLKSICCGTRSQPYQQEYLSFDNPVTYVPPNVPPTVHDRYGTVIFSILPGVRTNRRIDLEKESNLRAEELRNPNAIALGTPEDYAVEVDPNNPYQHNPYAVGI